MIPEPLTMYFDSSCNRFLVTLQTSIQTNKQTNACQQKQHLIPAYLSDLCVPAAAISGRQHLQSAANGTLLVQWVQWSSG